MIMTPCCTQNPSQILAKNKLRVATQYLRGHCEFNYHLNTYKPHGISKLCPHCDMEDETTNHFIGQCPMWFNKRGRYFNCYYTSVSEIDEIFLLIKSLAIYVPPIASINFDEKKWWSLRARENSFPRRAQGPFGLRYVIVVISMHHIPQQRRRRIITQIRLKHCKLLCPYTKS